LQVSLQFSNTYTYPYLKLHDSNNGLQELKISHERWKFLGILQNIVKVRDISKLKVTTFISTCVSKIIIEFRN
jgi:hypothetical protein